MSPQTQRAAVAPAPRASAPAAPPRLLSAMRSWYDSARKLPGAVDPCSSPRAAVCTTGVVFIAVYGGAPDLRPAAPSQLRGLELLAHTPLVDAPRIASERFAAWMERHGDRVGRIEGKLFDLAELRRAFAAMPYTQLVSMGMAAFGAGARATHVLLLDGNGWRVGISDIAYPADKPRLAAPEWTAQREGTAA